MIQNINDVSIPAGTKHEGVEVLKVLSRVVGDSDADTGYNLLLGDGEKVFVTDEQFMEDCAEASTEGGQE